jgi:hypothetical protein
MIESAAGVGRIRVTSSLLAVTTTGPGCAVIGAPLPRRLAASLTSTQQVAYPQSSVVSMGLIQEEGRRLSKAERQCVYRHKTAVFTNSSFSQPKSVYLASSEFIRLLQSLHSQGMYRPSSDRKSKAGPSRVQMTSYSEEYARFYAVANVACLPTFIRWGAGLRKMP